MNAEIKKLVKERPFDFWYRIALAKPKETKKGKPKAYIKKRG